MALYSLITSMDAHKRNPMIGMMSGSLKPTFRIFFLLLMMINDRFTKEKTNKTRKLAISANLNNERRKVRITYLIISMLYQQSYFI